MSMIESAARALAKLAFESDDPPYLGIAETQESFIDAHWRDWELEVRTVLKSFGLQQEMTGPTLDDLTREHSRLRDGVLTWMDAEGAAGRLRRNDQAPMWAEYVAVADAMAVMRRKLGLA